MNIFNSVYLYFLYEPEWVLFVSIGGGGSSSGQHMVSYVSINVMLRKEKKIYESVLQSEY